MEGESPEIPSIGGLLMASVTVPIDSIYCLCPSLCNVSKASVDFPEPDSPVTTTSLFFGIDNETFFRLCRRAFLITIDASIPPPFFTLFRAIFPLSIIQPWCTGVGFGKAPRQNCQGAWSSSYTKIDLA
jgi:hypothetical protein